MLRLKKVLLSTAIALSLASGSSMATYPTFDGFNLAEAVTNNIEAITARIERQIQEQIKRNLEKALFVKDQNSGSAKEMAKAKAEQDMLESSKNFDIAKDLAPIDTCDDVADKEFSERIEDAINGGDCEEPEENTDNVENTTRKAVTYTSISNQEEMRQMDAKETVDFCKTVLKAPPPSGDDLSTPSALAAYSWCSDPSLLIQDSVSAYSVNEAKAAKEQVKIITEPLLRKRSLSSLETNTPQGRMSLLKEFRKDLLIGMAQRVLNDAVDFKTPIDYTPSSDESAPGYFSNMQQLERFVLSKYLDKDWIHKVSNTHPDKSGPDGKDYSYTPQQVQREIAVIDGFLAHMAVLQYKSMLKQEMLQAAILSAEVNPVD